MRYMRIQLILEPYYPALEVVPTEEHGTGGGKRGDRTREFKRLDEGAGLAIFAVNFDYNF